ncbi:MAG: ABC transporter substrate-binding protein, partial [Ignavibacteriaceae bacterium]|nr:ABC transporter substrate-binding protein [Ignavibacteriaceae bacterium]
MKHFNKNLSKSFLLLLTMIVFSMIPLQSTTTLKKIVLAVHWQPQAQFAGYYAAITKGIYKKYGLDVTIRHTGFK